MPCNGPLFRVSNIHLCPHLNEFGPNFALQLQSSGQLADRISWSNYPLYFNPRQSSAVDSPWQSWIAILCLRSWGPSLRTRSGCHSSGEWSASYYYSILVFVKRRPFCAVLLRLPGTESYMVLCALRNLPLPLMRRGSQIARRSCQLRQVGNTRVSRIQAIFLMRAWRLVSDQVNNPWWMEPGPVEGEVLGLLIF